MPTWDWDRLRAVENLKWFPSHQAQLRLKPLESITASRSLSSSFSRSLCSSRRATRASRCSTTSNISFRICFSSASSFSDFRWSERSPCKFENKETLCRYERWELICIARQLICIRAFTFHGHPFPEFLLQSALSVLQLQLSGTWGQKVRRETG